MADYRLSAQIITRSAGRSAVAAAAYRAGVKLEDERTGLQHDYSRKGGVVHSELLTPANTPEWMHDRAKLWNAVEAIEKRKNSQLSREIQLSLPHELAPEQRTKLVQDFVQEQFVSLGMIADVNIHTPNPKGDERNHHAHVMLTMRELTGEGFHLKKSTPKARAWNGDDQLNIWREAWAAHQNKTLERHGHAERVDHRSYKEQGIDREPEHHRGTAANDMLVKGKTSRIEEENDQIRQRNSNRATLHARAAQLAAAMMQEKKTTAQQWAERKKKELSAQNQVDEKELARQHSAQVKELTNQQAQKYDLKSMTAEVKAIEKRLGATGFKAIVRNVTGATGRDASARMDMKKSINDTKKDIQREQQTLKVKQAEERLQQKREKRKKESQIQEAAKKRASAEFSQDFVRARNEPAQRKVVQEEKERKQWEQPKPKPKPPEQARKIAQEWREKMGSKPANDQTVTQKPTQKSEPEKTPQQSSEQGRSMKDSWQDKKRSKTPTPPPPSPKPSR